jgi:hypothetical protein
MSEELRKARDKCKELEEHVRTLRPAQAKCRELEEKFRTLRESAQTNRTRRAYAQKLGPSELYRIGHRRDPQFKAETRGRGEAIRGAGRNVGAREAVAAQN